MNGVRNGPPAGEFTAESLLDRILEGGQRLGPVFDMISDGPPAKKFRCAKSLLLLSERNPRLLYSRIRDIVGLLESENRILKWNAIAILGNLAAEDCRGAIEAILPKMYAFLSCGELITANHAIAALGKIGRLFPEKRKNVIAQLLKVEGCPFDTGECRNIAVGKVILALEELMGSSQGTKRAVEFARRHTGNSRAATARKAKGFLRRFAPGSEAVIHAPGAHTSA